MGIPVIDLFAGPGGLGEGFSSIRNSKRERLFDIKLSIEKDKHTHKTLCLRSFYRQFMFEDVPELYYAYIKANDPKNKEVLFEKLKTEYPIEWTIAEKESWRYELPHEESFFEYEIPERHREIDTRISANLSGNINWLLIGGPPCQAYSLAGRSRNQGISKNDHRVFLYKEYLRIIAKHHPAVFVMENVKGLLSAKIGKEKVFDWIKKDLRNPGNVFDNLNSPKYKVFSLVKNPDSYDKSGFPQYNNDKDFLIKLENYGIPQKRHRVILLGIREDIIHKPTILQTSEEVNLSEVLHDLPNIRSGIYRELDGFKENGENKYKKLTDSKRLWNSTIQKFFKQINAECNFEQKEFYFKKDLNTGGNFISYDFNNSELKEELKIWYYDRKLGGVLNHESRHHLKEDLARYLFSSMFLKNTGMFPRLKDYPEWLQPNHKNKKSGKFVDRFRCQLENKPATTITSHISKDGHYYIHYDPTQCRSFTVREAARIQTFPDNYLFCGSRTQQFHQVGNAVPPLLANQIAEIVLKIFNNK